jgi:glucose/arabinose dehydrogenase
VSIGSSCDACIETNRLRAAIVRDALDGTGGKPYATGLRNAVG